VRGTGKAGDRGLRDGCAASGDEWGLPVFCDRRHSVFSALLALGALLSLVLSACGGSDSSSTSTTTSSQGKEAKAKVVAKAEKEAAVRIRHFGHEAIAAQIEQVEASLARYLSAQAAADWVEACSYLPRQKRAELSHIAAATVQIKGRGCAGLLATVTEELSPSERSELGNADVTAVRVEGDRGYAIYALPGGAQLATPVWLEGGEWKVAGIEPRPLKS